jgi:two-component system nitrogen regulation response regulator GlnG
MAIDIQGALGNNPALFSRGACMPLSSSVTSVLLFTADSEVQTQLKHLFRDAACTAVGDRAAFHKESAKRAYDVVVVEVRDAHDWASTVSDIDASRTVVIAGSRPSLRRMAKSVLALHQKGLGLNGKSAESSLEGYLEMKMGDFVKGMRNGSARNLHPILISAVERPLIASALRETRGNQIQAAELLGLNRNTLRKKIVDLHIPLKRTRGKTGRAT